MITRSGNGSSFVYLPLIQSAGLTKTTGNGTFAFLKAADSGYHVEISGGKLDIATGSSLTLMNGQDVDGVVAIRNGGILTTTGQNTATIAGHLYNESGTIDLNGAGIGQLEVTKTFTMTSAATFAATVDCTNLLIDHVLATGNITLDGTLDGTAINIPEGGIPADVEWRMIAGADRNGTFCNVFLPSGLTEWYDSIRVGVRS